MHIQLPNNLKDVLTRHRCETYGVPHACPDCEEYGYFYQGPPIVNLVLWLIHPRKGASRGVKVTNIQQEDLPEVYKFLRTAADRNAERFSKVPNG